MTEVLKQIDTDFESGLKQLVINELSSIEHKHVMAESEYNLENTRLSVLKLAHGELEQIIYFTQKAKIDFRDVIMWATQDSD